jgi:hypothetical protein
LKVQQNGESGDWRRSRVVMLYLGGGDRWIELAPKERENQHGCPAWTIHGVLLLKYSFRSGASAGYRGGVQSL